MKKINYITLVMLMLTACNQPSNPVPSQPPQPQVAAIDSTLLFNGVSLKQVSLDAVYASLYAGEQSSANADSKANAVAKLQKVLNAWPESKKNESQSCYMQLQNETTRLQNIVKGLPAERYHNQPDFRFMCHDSIHYQYDKARMQALWNGL